MFFVLAKPPIQRNQVNTEQTHISVNESLLVFQRRYGDIFLETADAAHVIGGMLFEDMHGFFVPGGNPAKAESGHRTGF